MRMTFDRDFYRPHEREGCENLRARTYDDLPGAEVWLYECGKGIPYAAVFGGKRAKPDWHFRFKSAESREEKIAQWLNSERLHVERIKKERAERSAPHGFEPGQLFYASWGYDQTNVNYYKLEKLKGKTMGYIVPIGSKLNEERSEPPCDYVSPNPDCVRDWDVLLDVNRSDGERGKWKRLTKDGFSLSHTSASPCSADTERYETSAGWGH